MAPIIKSVFGGGGGVANLAYTASPTQGTVTSDTGTDAIIPAADGTNAGLFLPAEKTKLAGIAEGAEVNVNADWNASSGDAQILNKPTLGTAAATNSTDYATAAQGAKADTAVQPAAIGSTVLAFDSNLQSFVNAFTLPTTDGTAGQSLVTNGAGVISFATPAILADPVYIGGVAYFNRSTKPTERSSGVALVAGDRWYKTDDQTEWSWNGTYWLSLTEFLLSIPEIVGQTANQVLRGSSAATTGSIFVDRLVHQTAVLNSTNTATNYWTLAVQVSGVSTTTISTQNAVNYPHQQVSLGLVIPARSAIPTGGSVVFTPLGQTSRQWLGMTTLGTDVYACVYGGDIYKQTNGTGDFLPLGQISRIWRGMTTLGTDVYASVDGGDIYKQTNGTGNFVALEQTSRAWRGMTVLGTDVYACVYGGDIYKQTNGTGDFLPLSQTSGQWVEMTVLGTDIYACDFGGDIYKQTNGTGDFLPLSQTSRLWHGMTVLGTDVYACVYNGDIYKQTNGTGDFLPLSQTSRLWVGMTVLGTDIYASVFDGDIYNTSRVIDTVGHSARVTTTRVGTQTTSLYSAMSLTYRKVL